MNILIANRLHVESRVLAWGNGLGFRLSKKVADIAQLQANSEVTISVERGRIVIETKATQLTLAKLLADFDPERHSVDAMAFSPIGKEAL